MEVEHLVKEGLSHRKSIMARLDSYGDDYRSIPVLIPSEAEASLRPSQPSLSEKKSNSSGGKKRKLATSSSETPSTPDDHKRPARDPGMPKRPHNAFFYFSQERRAATQKEFPHLTKKEIAGMLSQKWSQLPPQEKEIYIQLQNERKRQYQAIMARYMESKGNMAENQLHIDQS